MLRVRISADVKCPHHPRRSYQERPAGCAICQSIADAAECARKVERELRSANRLGAELRWRNLRRNQRTMRPRVSAGPTNGDARAGAPRALASGGTEGGEA